MHKRQQQVIVWQEELPLVVKRRIVRGRKEFRSLSVIFSHNDTFENRRCNEV